VTERRPERPLAFLEQRTTSDLPELLNAASEGFPVLHEYSKTSATHMPLSEARFPLPIERQLLFYSSPKQDRAAVDRD
jgi:hypothetical protein